MQLIDAQVHAYERNHPGRPWAGGLHGPASATGDEMVAAMDAVGVAGALLVSPYGMYRYDGSYAQEVYAAHPTRFGLIKPVNAKDPAVADDVATWAAAPGAVAIRLMLNSETPTDAADPGIARVMAAAARHDLPVNLLIWGRQDQGIEIAARYPDTTLVIDHLGTDQKFEPPAPTEPWAGLPKVLALAAYPNVMIKISGAGTLSHQPYPFPDIWDPILRIIDGFSLERCLWGTDWTRAIAFLTYEQGVQAFVQSDRLSANDKVKLMGANLARVYRWAPS